MITRRDAVPSDADGVGATGSPHVPQRVSVAPSGLLHWAQCVITTPPGVPLEV